MLKYNTHPTSFHHFRTITPNSSGGTDHAWGGNFFLMGGKLKGGRIIGTHPDTYYTSPIVTGRGVVSFYLCYRFNSSSLYLRMCEITTYCFVNRNISCFFCSVWNWILHLSLCCSVGANNINWSHVVWYSAVVGCNIPICLDVRSSKPTIIWLQTFLRNWLIWRWWVCPSLFWYVKNSNIVHQFPFLKLHLHLHNSSPLYSLLPPLLIY